MALRLIEMVLPEDIGHYAHEYLRDQSDLPILGFWSQPLISGEVLVRVLLDAEHTEAVLDVVENRRNPLIDLLRQFFKQFRISVRQALM